MPPRRRLPPNRAPGSLHSVESADCVYPTDRVKRMVDVTDDDRLDLLVLGACRDGSVPGAWEVFPNEGDGFAPDPVHWWLPADNESVPWAEMADERCNTTEDALAGILDLNGDTLPDVVHTYGCDPDSGGRGPLGGPLRVYAGLEPPGGPSPAGAVHPRSCGERCSWAA